LETFLEKVSNTFKKYKVLYKKLLAGKALRPIIFYTTNKALAKFL